MATMPQNIKEPQIFLPVTLTDAATIALDASLGSYYTVTLGGNRTLGAPSNARDGMQLRLDVVQDGTGSRTLAYASSTGGYKFGSTYASPTLSTAAGAVDVLYFSYNAGATKWRCTNIAQGF